MENDYQNVTAREWVEYEFATIEYDYQLPPAAVARIKLLFDRLEKAHN
jgi:hypothetical protein